MREQELSNKVIYEMENIENKYRKLREQMGPLNEDVLSVSSRNWFKIVRMKSYCVTECSDYVSYIKDDIDTFIKNVRFGMCNQ